VFAGGQACSRQLGDCGVCSGSRRGRRKHYTTRSKRRDENERRGRRGGDRAEAHTFADDTFHQVTLFHTILEIDAFRFECCLELRHRKCRNLSLGLRQNKTARRCEHEREGRGGERRTSSRTIFSTGGAFLNATASASFVSNFGSIGWPEYTILPFLSMINACGMPCTSKLVW
jgi:hypothetical protein